MHTYAKCDEDIDVDVDVDICSKLFTGKYNRARCFWFTLYYEHQKYDVLVYLSTRFVGSVI